MANIYFSKESLTNAQNVIIDFLRSSGYEGSLEAGTAISDAVIKPNALLYSLFTQLVDRVQGYLSLQQATNQYAASEISSDEYDAMVDSILSNWFVTRNPGKPTTGNIRLWFLQPLEYIQFSDGDTIGAAAGVSLVADGLQVFSESNFSNVVNSTNNYNEYYIDVLVRSTVNTDVLISTDTSVTSTVSDIYYLRATIPSSFVPGLAVETSDAFITRTKEAITTRELITDRAIKTVIMENFDQVLNLYTAGHSDLEQIRDIIVWNDIKVHYGNKADIYIASALSTAKQSFVVGENGAIPVSELSDSVHLGHLVRAYKIVKNSEGVDTQSDVNITSVSIAETSWNSPKYKPTAITVDAEAGTTVTLVWLTDTSLGAIQEFVYADNQRIACYDPQVKHKFPVLLKFDVEVTLINEDTTSRAAVSVSIQNYIAEIAKSGSAYIESEMVKKIHDDVPNVSKVTLPVSCEATVFDPLSAGNITAPVSNTFDTSIFGTVSKQISLNTVQLYTDYSLITVS